MQIELHGVTYEVVSVPFADTTSSHPLFGPECFVFGVAVAETTGTTPAELRLVGGGGAQLGAGLDYTLAANESARDLWPLPGWPFGSGVFLDVVSGSVRGTIALVYPVTPVGV